MNNDPTNKDLMNFMAEMREEMATKDDLDSSIGEVRRELEAIKQRLETLEGKFDQVVFKEFVRLEARVTKLEQQKSGI